MQIYLIALKTSTERIRFQQAQLAALGLSAEFVDAVTPQSLPDSFTEDYWRTWERPLSPTERACFVSHLQLWQRIAESDAPALVLEDDVILSGTLPAFLQQAAMLRGVEHMSLETRARKKLISSAPMAMCGEVAVHRLYLDRSGAAGYLLWPNGARKLVARSSREAALADAMICRTVELASFQTVPAQLYQADVCRFFGRKDVLQTSSTVSSRIRPDSNRGGLFSLMSYKLRRIRTQIGFGIRTIVKLRSANRVMVFPGKEKIF